MRSVRAIFALLALCLGGAMFLPSADAADSTTWLCKPGQTDNPCSGPLGGTTLPAPGTEAKTFDYQPASKAPVDCFYVYPTQSAQAGPNANLDKDPPIRRVAVQQARQFSRVCNVYAPMYRQYVLSQIDSASGATVETAYGDVLNAWNDYLKNYNHGRPVILVGHSQGSTHLARLLREQIETRPEVQARIVSAIIPGTNISVRKGKVSGGFLRDFPGCTSPGEFYCAVSYNSYSAQPQATERLGRTDSGTWIGPNVRPDPARYDVLCTNPAMLDDSNGVLDPLVNKDYLSGVPASESPSPWWEFPDMYRAECRNENGASWLNVSRIHGADDTRLDIAKATAVGVSLHSVDVNLAENDLVKIAQLQSNAYVAMINSAKKKLGRLKVKLAAAKKDLARTKKACRTAKSRKKNVAPTCRPVKKLSKRVFELKISVKIFTQISSGFTKG